MADFPREVSQALEGISYPVLAYCLDRELSLAKLLEGEESHQARNYSGQAYERAFRMGLKLIEIGGTGTSPTQEMLDGLVQLEKLKLGIESGELADDWNSRAEALVTEYERMEDGDDGSD